RTAMDFPVMVFAGVTEDSAAVRALQAQGVEVISATTASRGLAGIFAELGRRTIQSVLVEGGATLAALLLEARLVDKVSFFIAPLIIGGVAAPSAVAGAGVESITEAFQLDDVQLTQHDRDLEITGYPRK